MSDTGIECLIPSLIVLLLAVLSRRTIEPLVGGALVGLLMLEPSELMDNLTATILKVMADETIGWIIMVCGLMGSLIALLVKIGGVVAFGNMLAHRINSRTGALLTAWALGLVIFIDDYLNALTISSSMKTVTDKFGVSREMLAYVVDSTAAADLRYRAAVHVGGVLCRGTRSQYGQRSGAGDCSVYQSHTLHVLCLDCGYHGSAGGIEKNPLVRRNESCRTTGGYRV